MPHEKHNVVEMIAFRLKPKQSLIVALSLYACVVLLVGCQHSRNFQWLSDAKPKYLLTTAKTTHVKYDLEVAPLVEELKSAEPRCERLCPPQSVWYMSLDEAIDIAFHDTTILRSLGASIVNSPQSAVAVFDSGIQASDPFTGIETAYSKFDSRFSSDARLVKNDDVFNNPLLGGGATEVRDDVTTAGMGLQKINRYGTQFTTRRSIEHSNSTNPSLLFPTSWRTVWEGTVRQPLLQGRGYRFNEIAGPTTQPGYRYSRGIVLSQIDNQITVAQFEAGVRRMIREINDAYWQLYMANKRLEASEKIRDLGLATWNTTKAKYDHGLAGGEADREALSRAQYLQFEAQVNADTNGNQSSGQVGVYQAEANLRRLLGLPQSDERIILPCDEPFVAPMTYDWQWLAALSTETRLEVQQQVMRVKQRELELIAAKNFLQPRLDLIATYRSNGFGDRLAGGTGRFSSALGDALTWDHAEAEFGLQYDMPVGFRQAHAAVKNARLQLYRERAVLEEVQQQILFEVGSTLRALYRHQADFEIQSSRLDAARAAVKAREAAFAADSITIDQLLESHMRLLDAERAYYDTLLAIQLTRTQLNYESGQLLNDSTVAVQDIDIEELNSNAIDELR